MPCKVCKSDFNVFNWKFKCGECSDKYCKKCLTTLDGIMYCEKCHILLKRPPDRNKLMELKSKDLQEYLQKHNKPTRGLVEKRELVDLLCAEPIPVKQKSGTEKLKANFAGSVPNLKSTALQDILGSIESTLFHSDSVSGMGTSTSQNTSRPPPNTRTHTRQPPPYPTCAPRHPHPPSPPTPPSQHSSNSYSFGSGTPPEPPGWRSPGVPESPPRPTAPVEESDSEWERVSASEVPSAAGGTQGVAVEAEVEEEPLSARVNAGGTHLSSTQSPLSSPHLQGIKLSDFENAEELDSLSSKQLKTLLQLNRVDFKGCVEKTELIERAKRLWYDNNKYKKEPLPDDLDELCKICMDAPLDCVLLECGHIATCISCGKKLAECPVCRQYVTRVVRTFKA